MLPCSLACVGLARVAEKRSEQRIQQLIVWPERVLPLSSTISSASACSFEFDEPEEIEGYDETPQRPFISYTRTDDGASLFTEIRVLRAMFPRDGDDVVELQSGGELSLEIDTDDEGGYDTDEDSRVQIMPITPPLDAGHQISLSLPPKPIDRNGNVMNTIPIHWARGNAHRSMSLKIDTNHSTRQWDGHKSGGRKRCLQLDLRGIEDDVEKVGALGKPCGILSPQKSPTAERRFLTLSLSLTDRAPFVLSPFKTSQDS